MKKKHAFKRNRVRITQTATATANFGNALAANQANVRVARGK
ncbi:hypothetical protein NZD89_10210 [Alicyclobacillus fastidiosus]|uniref:Uncharacterized protein n=1 Tax=Alicyclobacillus fastidiosus TaxID=392011 RepID=A0ABY6ZLD2_9BACL|nr:hypothetical protein [Alicyclobacillus fastidiosus]WAH43718.1 hypothetical protein NZD89_10210 [Alicyclobacillus fastidiosus]GMA59930.1 hypothetical protein GCM10025859_03700 [Alicyclobacillus fastidiosus]